MARYSHGELVQLEQAGKNAEKCVCCGAVIPEGRQVCPVCFRGGKIPNYKSPAEMIFSDMELKFRGEVENKIVTAVQKIDVLIDKAGLIRALEADRKVQEGKLVEVVRCEKCFFYKDGTCLNDKLPISGDDATAFYPDPDWYCADGKRRTDNGKTDG